MPSFFFKKEQENINIFALHITALDKISIFLFLYKKKHVVGTH